MKNNTTSKDIIYVSISSVISLISSILNGFVMPVALGTLNYGYYKIFALYASYTTLCHFGFNDGILLSYGGKKFSKLNKYKFRSNSVFFIIFQCIVSIVIIFMGLFTSNSFLKILFLLLGINSFSQNILAYYQNISQTTLRFNEYSVINIIQYILLILAVLGILLYYKIFHLRNISYIPYVIFMITINFLLIIWYLYDYRGITFGNHEPIFHRFTVFKKYFITGSYLTFGYGISVLIFNLDSQFVVHFFSVRTYGIYGFAYSMISAGLIILGSAAVVLLPHLKQHSKSYILNNYSNSISYVILLVYLSIVGYFPLKIIINKFISEYSSALIYFRILLPGLVITCCVSIVIANYYYALNKEKFYFYLSLIVLFLSFVIDCVMYISFKSTKMLALASVLSLIVWYILSNHFIVKWYHVKWVRNLLYIFVMMIIFFVISQFNNIILCTLTYLLGYTFVSILLFKNIFVKFGRKLLSKI